MLKMQSPQHVARFAPFACWLALVRFCIPSWTSFLASRTCVSILSICCDYWLTSAAKSLVSCSISWLVSLILMQASRFSIAVYIISLHCAWELRIIYCIICVPFAASI